MNLAASTRTRRACIATLWLTLGLAALGLGLVPAHSTALGWTPLFWLLLAPAMVLGLTAPGAPMQLWRQLRRRTPRRPAWSA